MYNSLVRLAVAASVARGDLRLSSSSTHHVGLLPGHNIGALIIRTGFWAPLNYNYNKEPPKIVLVIVEAHILFRNYPNLKSQRLVKAQVPSRSTVNKA